MYTHTFVHAENTFYPTALPILTENGAQGRLRNHQQLTMFFFPKKKGMQETPIPGVSFKMKVLVVAAVVCACK